MKGKEDAVAGVLFILLGLAFLAMSWSFPKGSQDGVPGPGYFPIIISFFLIALSVLMIVVGLVKKTSFNFFDELFKANLPTFLLTIVVIIGYLVLWSLIPFILNTSAFLIALGMIFQRGLKANITFSIAISVIIYFLFGHVFHVML